MAEQLRRGRADPRRRSARRSRSRRVRAPPACTRRAGTAGGINALSYAFTDFFTSDAAQRTRRRSSRARRSARSSDDPAGRRGALPAPPHRHQAHLRRHRLLRDLQPRQRRAGRPPPRADRGASPRGASGPRPREYAVDCLVFAIGFDAMTGALLEIDIRGAGGASAGRAVGRRPAHVPRPRGRRLAEPVHGHRPGQPVGAEQHGGLDRAARRLDRDAIEPMRTARASSAIEATREAEDGWVQARRGARPTRRSTRRPTSWYVGANMPGKPRVFMPYVAGCGDLSTGVRRGGATGLRRIPRSRRAAVPERGAGRAA